MVTWREAGYYAGIRHVCAQLALVAGIGLCLPAMAAVKTQAVRHQPLLDEPQMRMTCPSCSIQQTIQPWSIEGVGLVRTESHMMLTRLLSFQCGHCDFTWTAKKSKELSKLRSEDAQDDRQAAKLKARRAKKPELPTYSK